MHSPNFAKVTQMVFVVIKDWYHHIVLTHSCKLLSFFTYIFAVLLPKVGKRVSDSLLLRLPPIRQTACFVRLRAWFEHLHSFAVHEKRNVFVRVYSTNAVCAVFAPKVNPFSVTELDTVVVKVPYKMFLISQPVHFNTKSSHIRCDDDFGLDISAANSKRHVRNSFYQHAFFAH